MPPLLCNVAIVIVIAALSFLVVNRVLAIHDKKQGRWTVPGPRWAERDSSKP
jgi:hypothetical protein